VFDEVVDEKLAGLWRRFQSGGLSWPLMSRLVVQRIQASVDAALPAGGRSLLAVSGGVDSMVMLHAAAVVRPAERLVVATYDHASGPHSQAAADLVERTAVDAGISFVMSRGVPEERPSEAAWRDARLRFLRAAADEHGAVICTAHTRDDQAETVLFRELRGASTRGLAGLAAPTDMRRPLLSIARAEVTDYARDAGVEWVDDPTNVDRAFARNRLRHDLIPALRNVRPTIEAELVEVGQRAARWRADVDAFIDARLEFHADPHGPALEVSRESLAGHADEALAILWPALLGRLGIAADWRGTTRLVAFTTRGRTGQRIQLSGGWTVYRRRRAFEIRRDRPTEL
jgi:tRNA(Ile)-lysidine synthase